MIEKLSWLFLKHLMRRVVEPYQLLGWRFDVTEPLCRKRMRDGIVMPPLKKKNRAFEVSYRIIVERHHRPEQNRTDDSTDPLRLPLRGGHGSTIAPLTGPRGGVKRKFDF